MTDFLDKNRDKITETVKRVAGFMSLECQVEIREELGQGNKVSLVVSLYTPDDARFLIGKNGQNLGALEHLMRSIFMRDSKDIAGISVDVNDYRRSRASYVVDVAKQAVQKVRNTQKSEVLSPMSSYERRMVHMELASCPDISTESIGEGLNRRIVIKPYP